MDNHKRDSDRTAQQLIDIFYKDTYRLDSIISQINNGALQSVTTKTDKTQSSVSDLGGSVGLTQLLSASGKNTSSESVGKHIEETRKIGDDLLIQLIRQLNITPQSNNFTKVFSYLNIISGTINLKNFKLIAQIIDSEETISLNYGARLPGKWNILGIIDYKENSDAEPNENDIIAMLHKSMNQIAGALINSTSKATIIPIMIYRNLCHNYL